MSTTDERGIRLADRLRTERSAQHAAELAGEVRVAKQHADVCKQLVDEALAPELRVVVRTWLAEYAPAPVEVGISA